GVTRQRAATARGGCHGSTTPGRRATLEATPLRSAGIRSGRPRAPGVATVPESTDLPTALHARGPDQLAPLFQALYAELKRIAARRVQQMGPNQTLSATA